VISTVIKKKRDRLFSYFDQGYEGE